MLQNVSGKRHRLRRAECQLFCRRYSRFPRRQISRNDGTQPGQGRIGRLFLWRIAARIFSNGSGFVHSRLHFITTKHTGAVRIVGHLLLPFRFIKDFAAFINNFTVLRQVSCRAFDSSFFMHLHGCGLPVSGFLRPLRRCGTYPRGFIFFRRFSAVSSIFYRLMFTCMMRLGIVTGIDEITNCKKHENHTDYQYIRQILTHVNTLLYLLK